MLFNIFSISLAIVQGSLTGIVSFFGGGGFGESPPPPPGSSSHCSSSIMIGSSVQLHWYSYLSLQISVALSSVGRPTLTPPILVQSQSKERAILLSLTEA